MFATTVINFLLFSLGTGTLAAACIILALTLNTEHPLSEEKQEFVDNALQNLNIVCFWSVNLPVSSNLSLLNSNFRVYSCFVEILLSDLIVIWRAWVLFQDRQRIILIPFILWIGVVGE